MTPISLALLLLAPQVTIYESEPNDLCTQVNVVNDTIDLELVGRLLGGDVDRFEVVIPPGLPGPLFITLLDVPGAEVVAELAPSCGAAGDAIADGLGPAIAPRLATLQRPSPHRSEQPDRAHPADPLHRPRRVRSLCRVRA